MAAFMFRGRSLKSRRLKGRADVSEEHIILDYNRDPTDNFKETLYHIAKHEKLTKAKRLGYYNALVRLCYRFGSNYSIGVSAEEMCCCLRLGLLHESKEVRAACLRTLRYVCQDERCIDAMLHLNMDYLVARSLDLNIDNEIERIHAMRLIKKMLQVSGHKFPQSLVSALISIANNGAQERDKLHRTALALLCELSFSSPCLVCRRGGVTALLNNVLQCHTLPRLNESLLTAVLYLLNHPCSRHFIHADVGIEQLLAPFTDCHFKFTTEVPENSFGEETSKYTACKTAIATLVKSWPGLIRLCRPDGTGLQSLIGVLYLPYNETRKEVLDLMFDVFRLHVPEWTDDFAHALVSVDPSEMRESWRISEGFVAEEGRCLLGQLAHTRANLVDNHMALVLSAFVTGGLLEALVEVITDADSRVSVRATILLGQLLHLANKLIPIECGYHSHCLPTLIDLASSFNSPKRNKASMAVKCLDRLHNMKKRGPVPCSLFLDQLVTRARSRGQERVARPLSTNRDMLLAVLDKPAAWHHKPKKLNTLEKLATVTTANNDVEHDVNQAMKDSLVLQTKENLQWDWQLVSAILKWPDDSLKKLEDQGNQRFVRRLLYFFKPVNKLFCALELTMPLCARIASAGQHFLSFLLNCQNDESRKYLKEWLGNVGACLSEIKGQRAPPDALLSAHRVINTCAQYYFLYIGLLSGTAQGDQLLDSMGIYQCLLELVSTTSHDNYVKLVVSSLDYGKQGVTRVILAKALTSSSDNARVYCVNLLRVLMRARVPFLHQWGLDLLVQQLYDPCKAVSMQALSVLAEACEDELHLQSAIKLKPSLLQLGTKGAMVMARFMSLPQGFQQLMEANFVQQQLDSWNKTLNAEYVDIAEERLYEAFTTYEKSYDGSYFRRSSRRQSKEAVVPVHIYGQLVQHRDGAALLQRQRQVQEYAEIIEYQTTRTEDEVHRVKEALWALGHAGTSALGLDVLQEYGVIPQMIRLAEESGVFSLRGTAYYALGLISCTCKGADILNEFGWESVRHKHTDKWPVLDDPATYSLPHDDGKQLSTCASAVSLASSVKSEGFILPAVTLEPPQSQSKASPPAFTIGGEDTSAASSYKSRSNTVNTLETLSENESGDPDGDREIIINVGGEEGESEVNGEEDLPITNHVDNSSDYCDTNKTDNQLPINSAIENTTDVAKETSSNHHNEHSNSNYVHEVRVANLMKIRSQSTPMDYDKRGEAIHPRTNSDPRGMCKNKLDSQAAVHFRDPDLEARTYDRSILRKKHKHTGSDSTGDAGISCKSSLWTGGGGERAGSHDSYRTAADHSRSNSVNTDTSGVGSFGSSFPSHANEQPTLSPIPSAGSLHTESRPESMTQAVAERNSVHPSDSMRRSANLKRVPSTKRRFSNPVLSPILKTLQRDSDIVNEYVLSYTSTRDVQGYATLRELKRFQRLDSIEAEADTRIRSLNEQPSPLLKTQSLDLRTLGRIRDSFRKKLRRPKIRRKVPEMDCIRSSARNMSMLSLQEMDIGTQLVQTLPSSPDLTGTGIQRIPTIPNIRKPKPVTTGRPEYMGICLPVDVTMLFHVNEGEDMRSFITLKERSDRRRKKSSVAMMEAAADSTRLDDGLEHHCAEICLACYTPQRAADEQAHQSDTDQDEAFSPVSSQAEKTATHSDQCIELGGGEVERRRRREISGLKLRHTSLSELVDSVTSQGFIQSKGAMSEETFEGRVLVRKEILRLVVQCSSSVSTESTEQSLLILKQKFTQTFQDVCLYSEISFLLASYNYRLKSRRFIQELFQDTTFEKLQNDAHSIAARLAQDMQQNKSQGKPRLDSIGDSEHCAEGAGVRTAQDRPCSNIIDE